MAEGDEVDEQQGRDGESESASRRPFARRRRRVQGGRQHRHEVKVTPEEEAQLLVLASRYRVSVPKLLIDSALAGGAQNAAANRSVREELASELFRVNRLLAGVATNVNQMAKATNATGEVQADMTATFAAVRRTADRIDVLLEQLIEATRR